MGGFFFLKSEQLLLNFTFVETNGINFGATKAEHKAELNFADGFQRI